MNMLKMCLNPKVIAGLAAAGAGIYILAPGLLVAALPLLLLAACPLSMLLMGGAMMGGRGESHEERVSSPARGGDEQAAEIARSRSEVESLRVRADGNQPAGAKTNGS